MNFKMNIHYHVTIAFLLRFALLLYGVYHDKNRVVKYTDIDYVVFTDAARYLYNGDSPFERDTYRYSPLLAFLLSPNIFLHESFGKLLFSLFDVFTGFLIYKILQKYGVDENISLFSSNLWLYNPLCAVICTRGSCDAIMTALVLLSIFLFQNNKIKLFSIIYGITVHFRLYPCIYALAFYTALSNSCVKKSNFPKFTKFVNIAQLNGNKCMFLVFSAIGFLVPTLIAYYFYDMKFINEAFLYHVTRKDIKHNFSPYFYFLYLSDSVDRNINIFSFLPFMFQVILLLVCSWVFSSKSSLPCCIFIQTCIFVTFNKVCTSQYFVWYLCLFPLIVPLVKLKWSIFLILFVWLGSQALWLIPAYYLEFESKNSYILVWGASLQMFLVNIYLLYLFCKNCPVSGYKKLLAVKKYIGKKTC